MLCLLIVLFLVPAEKTAEILISFVNIAIKSLANKKKQETSRRKLKAADVGSLRYGPPSS